jgi:hypothetical protein
MSRKHGGQPHTRRLTSGWNASQQSQGIYPNQPPLATPLSRDSGKDHHLFFCYSSFVTFHSAFLFPTDHFELNRRRYMTWYIFGRFRRLMTIRYDFRCDLTFLRPIFSITLSSLCLTTKWIDSYKEVYLRWVLLSSQQLLERSSHPVWLFCIKSIWKDDTLQSRPPVTLGESFWWDLEVKKDKKTSHKTDGENWKGKGRLRMKRIWNEWEHHSQKVFIFQKSRKGGFGTRWTTIWRTMTKREKAHCFGISFSIWHF